MAPEIIQFFVHKKNELDKETTDLLTQGLATWSNSNYNKDYSSQENNLHEIDDPYIEQNEVNDTFNHDRDITSDWNDDSFKNW